MRLRSGATAIDAPTPPERVVAAATPKPKELPRGGRTILPDFRVVAYYGAPQDRRARRAGDRQPDHAARRLAHQAAPYGGPSRPVLPALELLAVVAAGAPGRDGLYRLRQPDSVIRRYLKAARKAKALLVLDIQPGRSDFFTETTRLRKWLKEPDVGLALDPEWRMGPGEVPGKVIGKVGAREVNATTAWLSQLVKRYDLPQKLLLIHQFTDNMVPEAQLKEPPGLALRAQRRRLRLAGGQGLQVPQLRRPGTRLPPRLQALLPRGRRHDVAAAGDATVAAPGRRRLRVTGAPAWANVGP